MGIDIVKKPRGTKPGVPRAEWITKKMSEGRRKSEAERRARGQKHYLEKSLERYTLDGEFVARYGSQKEALAALEKEGRGVVQSALSRALNGKALSCAGSIWKWL